MARPPVARIAFWLLVAVVMAPAVLITLSRLVEPHLGLAIQLQAFTPFGLPLYGVALLLVLGYAVILRLRRRTLRTAAWPAAVVALGGLVLHGWWFAPQLTGSLPGADDTADRVTVMSVNLLNGRAETDVIVEQVREYGVDVLVASEMTPRALAGLDEAGLGEILGHRVGEPGEEGTPDGTMVFTREPVEVVAELDTVMDSMLVAIGGLEVLAVHPSPPIFPDRWRDDHALVEEAVDEHRPDLVVGDFNATNDHGPLRALRDAGYRDAIELTNDGFRPTWPVTGGVGLIGAVGVFGPVAQIDHVLVDDGYTVLESSTRDLDGSDHRLVLATVAARE